MKRTVGKIRKKGIEITRWKVGDADDFQSMEHEEDYGIELAPPEDYETNETEECNTSD